MSRRDLQREDVFPVSMRALVGGVRGNCDHLVPHHGLRQSVRNHIEFDDLADAATPIHVVAFDVRRVRGAPLPWPSR